jgi:AraC family transcriptional activator of pobA
MRSVAPILELKRTAASMPFEIHTMQWIEENRKEQNSVPHRHDYFVIIWIIQGHGKHLVDLETYTLEPGTVFCISPGQIHHLMAEPPMDGFVISFSTEFIRADEEVYDMLFNTGLFYTFCNSPVIKVSEDMKEPMEDMALKMMKEYANFFLLRSEILKGFLKIFLIYLTRQYQPQTQGELPNKSVELVKKFLNALEKNFLTKKMVSEYAEELVVTPNYLNEVVKKITGFTASHHIQQRIVMEAKRKAAYSNQSMKEIAYELGFDDTAHFSKFFRNASGLNFSEFKKGLMGKTP